MSVCKVNKSVLTNWINRLLIGFIPPICSEKEPLAFGGNWYKFYRPDAFTVIQPTVSKHKRKLKPLTAITHTHACTHAWKEPACLVQKEGFTLIPWCGGRPLAWGVIVCTTVAASRVTAAGAAAEQAADRKSLKYAELPAAYGSLQYFDAVGWAAGRASGL